MAEEPDRLSELSDDLLQHILHLAPSREAVTAAVLSRRWRGLWPPPTGAVRIDIPSSGDNYWPYNASLRAATEALAASFVAVERLAIDVGDGLSLPATRNVKDVRISAETSTGLQTTAGNDDDDFLWLQSNRVVVLGEFWFSFGSVPSAALRVLHMTNCCDLTQAPLPTFPCLEVLQLGQCIVALQRLRDMVAASPQLAAQLEHVRVCSTFRYNYDDDYSGRWDLAQSFCCPGITTLVILDCSCQNDAIIDLDMPRVQYFKYRGKINQFTLRSPLPDPW